MRCFVTCLTIMMAVAFSSAARAQESLFVLKDGTGVYEKSSTLSEKITELAAGDKVFVVDHWGAWIQIEVADTSTSGWALSNRLGKIFPLPETAGDVGTSPSESADEASLAEKVAAVLTHNYRIELYGSVARKFRMTCKILFGSGQTATRRFVETYPQTIEITARLINCRVRRDNPTGSRPLRVRVFVDGDLVRAFQVPTFTESRFSF